MIAIAPLWLAFLLLVMVLTLVLAAYEDGDQ